MSLREVLNNLERQDGRVRLGLHLCAHLRMMRRVDEDEPPEPLVNEQSRFSQTLPCAAQTVRNAEWTWLCLRTELHRPKAARLLHQVFEVEAVRVVPCGVGEDSGGPGRRGNDPLHGAPDHEACGAITGVRARQEE